MTTAMLPARYRVIARCEENHDTVTLGMEPVDRPIAACLPGQFTMLYAFGVGEVPVSVSGIGEVRLAQTLRAVGAVTRALCAAVPGQMIGVRGPYGTDWGLSGAAAEGRDLVVGAGGIGLAPLRPVLLEALAARERYVRVVLLVGARTPEDLIFARELDVWRRRGVDVETTIDRPVQGWDGQVGFVSQLVHRASTLPARWRSSAGPR
ncbi:MAG: oxidoreductase [Micromonosporaceae bacterium]